MGSRPSKSAIRIDFREHLKTQKEVVFEQEVTKGVRPVRGRTKQSGERNSTIFHINHETLENRLHPDLHFHHETSPQNSNIRNPKARSGGSGVKLMDNRIKAASDKYPFCCIGLLQVQFQNRRIRGTAFLISSNWLLTCAHNFYDRGQHRMGSHATFTLGLQEREEIVRENGKEVRTRVDVGENIDISAWRIPDQYISGPDQQAQLYDFALVKLKNFHNLQEKYGYFGLDSVWSFQRAQTATELIIAGYPREVKGVNGKCKALIEARGQWTEILNEESVKKSERLLYVNYQIYTSPGQSGSPIFYETKEREYFMVGIHTLGGEEENSGILVTPKTREIINGWIEEMKTIFDISNRNIGNQGMQEFIANFMQMSGRITELQLANNRIGPQGIKFLMETKWSNLKLLNLENNNIKVEGAKHLAHPSNGWKTLEYLNLNNTMIGDEGFCALLQNRAWLKLKELHLKRCLLSRTTVSELVLNDWGSLQTLNLGINDLSSSDIKLLFSPIHDAQGKSERRRFAQLKNLNLCKNPIGNEGLRAVVLAELELFSLNITGIGISEQGMEILGSRKWGLLRKLHLDWNKEISIEGIRFLTPEVFPSLSYANLDWTTLGAQGVRLFMNHQWKTLRNLSINHNYLGDQGLNDLRSLQTLEVLVLEGNNLTTDGVKAFAEKEEWRQLLQLRLRSNHIKKTGFLEIITRLKDLNYLDINNNGLDAHEKREIKELAGRLSPNLHIQVDMGEEADYT